jgi:predicted Fe-Mo cluster-binding NifX family protein
MKLAFTSSNGIMVDTHFGKANMVYIYEIKRGGIYFRGTRKILNYSTTECIHYSNDERLKKIYKTIDDCEILYTAAIGDAPLSFFHDKGVQVETTRGTINSVFLKL